MRRAVLVFAAACAASAASAGCHGHDRVDAPAGPTTRKLGAITVLAREHDSGEVVAHAELALRGPTRGASTSSEDGFATFDHLLPGSYDLTATFAGQPVEVSDIDVHPNQTSYVDVVFTLDHPDPVKLHYGDAHAAEIERYRPASQNATVAHIEGTVTDSASHGRVEGAVITAVDPARPANALQTVSDEQGRYKFDDVLPGTYVVSASYSVTGRGQIEVRRSGIELTAGDAVIVPLVIELAH